MRLPAKPMHGRVRVFRIEEGPLNLGASEVQPPEQPAHTETRIGMIT